MRIAVVEINDGNEITCQIPKDLVIAEANECIIDILGVLEYGRVIKILNDQNAIGAQGKKPVVMRRATLQDQAREKENTLMSKMASCNVVKNAEKHKLPMRMVRIKYNFDRTVFKVVFAAEERVDFRQMVKDLAVDLKVRIEMKQIGVRDEAGIIGGFATCGRPLCCCSWMQKFESVNVRMAKNQRLSLNPGAISGMCGRLKCCLRFENEVYSDMAGCPNKGRSNSEGNTAKCAVVDQNVLKHGEDACFDDDHAPAGELDGARKEKEAVNNENSCTERT